MNDQTMPIYGPAATVLTKPSTHIGRANIKVTGKDTSLVWSGSINAMVPAWIEVDVVALRLCRDRGCGAKHYPLADGTRTHVVDGGYPETVTLRSDTLYWDEDDAWYISRVDEDLVYFYPDADCPGHPAGPSDPMGATVYCDGTCQERW